MHKRGFPVQILKIYLSWFCNMYVSVKYNNVASDWSRIKLGVLHGGLLGGKLYNFIVETLQILEINHLGCYAGNKLLVH